MRCASSPGGGSPPSPWDQASQRNPASGGAWLLARFGRTDVPTMLRRTRGLFMLPLPGAALGVIAMPGVAIVWRRRLGSRAHPITAINRRTLPRS